ncbi:hypothetical protein GCM10010168_63070 [Actinoplanes ianthinogenes]|uniref:CHAT domain-containing protein n=1 Tax=Actinoplanes ianthinogenes TaxID=122358 RepID=A0ABM7LJM2_9ACTN|nr:CHAT domain-containing tetratricopeptide repeat protein [Actinoplanes ianthinogenes]BCJ39445.1 hypothetical protein Aiant_01020 [Actinoplanes ianthinogenes]GGR36046.1 hypothetical protein GCM10010168_63070 [Actinoplanes ianthinogenes]
MDLERMLRLMESLGNDDPANGPMADLAEALRCRMADDLTGARRAADRAMATMAGKPLTTPGYAETLRVIASIQRQLGQYAETKRLLDLAHQALAATDGPQAPTTETVLRALADVHCLLGEYDEAMTRCRQALRITEPRQDLAHGFGLQLLARIHSALDDLPAAERANRAAAEILRRHGMAGHVAANLSQAGIYQARQGNAAGAIRLNRQALRLREREFGQRHSATAESLITLATAYAHAGRSRRALRLTRRAIGVYRAAGADTDAFRLASALLDAGQLGFDRRRRTAAGDTAAGLDLAVRTVGEHHPLVIRGLVLRGRVRARAGDRAAAFADLVTAADRQNRLLGPVFGATPEEGRLRFLADTRKEVRDWLLEALIDSGTTTGPDVAAALRLVIQRTGLTTEAAARECAAVLAGGYPDLAADLDRLSELDRLLAGGMLGGAGVPADAVRERAAIEERIAGRVREARPSAALTELDLAEVAAALPAGSCLVQFVRFAHRGLAGIDHRDARYAAFCLPAGDAAGARVVDLGDAGPIDRAVEAYRAVVVPGDDRIDRDRWLATGTAVHQALFAPLPTTATRLVIVPDGLIHRIPPATLPGPDGLPLVTTHTISHLSSPRDLLIGAAPADDPNRTALILADPDFGPGPVAFNPLPGTAREARMIGDLLGAEPLTGAAATKSALRRDPPPSIVHLATHGFVRVGADDRIEAGLGLAGANDRDADGILSADEIARLDLRGTRLVVASACETALGRIHDSEGAFGLHRSFAIAGARAVVASLWSVPDRPTARLMTAFYRAYLRSGSAPSALAEAQREAAAQHRPVTEWGAFTCHGIS